MAVWRRGPPKQAFIGDQRAGKQREDDASTVGRANVSDLSVKDRLHVANVPNTLSAPMKHRLQRDNVQKDLHQLTYARRCRQGGNAGSHQRNRALPSAKGARSRGSMLTESIDTRGHHPSRFS